MKDYSTYQTEDLARDAYFRQSVLSPDEASAAFWASWKAGRPDREESYKLARLLVLGLDNRYKDQLTEDDIRRRVKQMTDRLSGTAHSPFSRRSWFEKHGWKVAAVFLIGILLVARERFENNASPKSRLTTIPSGKPANEKPVLLTRVNESPNDQTIVLNDNTVVTLFPGSSITFPAHFNDSERPVTLHGDAFFEVTPNPSRPFLVYAGETITKVLGTSFRIRAFRKDNFVKVSVRSGKVSVFKSDKFGSPGYEGIILTPNEQVVFNRPDESLKKSPIGQPTEIVKATDSIEFIFDDTPVTEVFRQLEQQYGMEIEFDPDVFSSCPITTSFKDESLLERINGICQAIGATYTPSDGKIVINGTGCAPL